MQVILFSVKDFIVIWKKTLVTPLHKNHTVLHSIQIGFLHDFAIASGNRSSHGT